MDGWIFKFILFIFSHLQNALPANGAPVTRQRTGRIREMYQDFVVQRTVANWKFWIVSFFIVFSIIRFDHFELSFSLVSFLSRY